MKRSFSIFWTLLWLVFSLVLDLASQVLLKGDPIAVLQPLPLWVVMPGYAIWAALTLLSLLSLSRQPGRGFVFAILMFVLWGFGFISLTAQGYFFWMSGVHLGKELHALYTQLVTATPGFLRLDAALLAVMGLFRLFKEPRSTL